MKLKYSVTDFATTVALNAVENKIPNIGNLVKKKHYDAKISDIESRCLTPSDYNKFTNEITNNKIKEKQLIKKSDISGFTDNNTNLDKKIATLATKAELKSRAR